MKRCILFILIILILFACLISILKLKHVEKFQSVKKDVPGKTIWIYSPSGWDEPLPTLQKVKTSWERLNPEWNIELLSLKNLHTYVNYNIANKSIQLQVLNAHGGVWVDASIMCLRPLDTWIFDFLQPSGFWAFNDGSNAPSQLFMAAMKEGPIINEWASALKHYDLDPISLFNHLYHHDIMFKNHWDCVPSINVDVITNLMVKLPEDANEIDKVTKMSLDADFPKPSTKRYPYTLQDFVVVSSDCKHVNDVGTLINICDTKGAQLMIYDKCNFCKHVPSNVLRRPLQNVGREGETFVTFVLNHYDDLPKDIIMVPTNLSKHNRKHRLLRLFESSNTGCGGLLDLESNFTINVYENTPIFPSEIRPLSRWYESRIGSWDKHNKEGPCWNGMMRTTRERIHRTSKEKLLVIQHDLRVHNNPEVGHFMERVMANVY